MLRSSSDALRIILFINAFPKNGCVMAGKTVMKILMRSIATIPKVSWTSIRIQEPGTFSKSH